MRFYDVAVASLAIDAPAKWTDNVLSQHEIPGISTARRGVARRIPHATLLHLALTRELHAVLGLSVRDALSLARQLLVTERAGEVRRGSIVLTLDRAHLERTVERRLRDALESAPTPRRGPRRGPPARRRSE